MFAITVLSHCSYYSNCLLILYQTPYCDMYLILCHRDVILLIILAAIFD